MMVARKKYTFWINPEQAEGLKTVKLRDGVLESEQIRRALDDWLKGKGVIKKAARPRALTRGRA